jgi:hypothetical protein
MAGDWMKFEKATPDKPEVFAIAARLDMDPDAVVGKLFRVWSWFDTHTVDGNGAGVTRPLLDRIAGVTGFVAAMESVSWVVVAPSGVSLPNFDRHTGETAKSRALGAKRASEHRAKSNAPTVTPAVTAALPREEKRREEKEEQEKPRTKGRAVTLPKWTAALDADAVPADDPLFDWAQTAGIPRDWIALAWWAFEARYESDAKTYADWRAVFRRAVREDWLRLWRQGRNGWELTTAGESVRREMEAANV